MAESSAIWPDIRLTEKAEWKKAYVEKHDLRIKLLRELRDCRNELCLKCGNYTQAHNGACDGCRWRRK